MAFLDSLSGKIINAGQSIAQSTKNFKDVTKFKNNISGYEKQITELYTIVGKGYYERHKNDPDTEDKININAINSLFKQINDLKEHIKEIEGITKCPKCGADVPNDASFCNNCGCKIIKETEGLKKCPKCGSNVSNNALFCVNCGFKIPKEPEGRRCSNCGKPLAENSMFCANCGTKVVQEKTKLPDTGTEISLQNLCVKCHSILTEEDVFCPECGTPVRQKLETENSSSESLSAKQEEV